jgi:hypothetical protein
VTAEGRLDDHFAPNVSAWTGGRPAMVMRYLQDGKGVASVLHTEEIEADWSGEYDDAVIDEVTLGSHFRLWLLDFEKESAKQLDGVVGMDGQFHGKTIDGRYFVFLPYDGYARTRIYEVFTDGTATEHLDTAGWVYDWCACAERMEPRLSGAMGFDQPAAARANALGGIRADEDEALIEDVEETIRQLQVPVEEQAPAFTRAHQGVELQHAKPEVPVDGHLGPDCRQIA